MSGRYSRVVVDLDAIRHNVRRLIDTSSPARLMAVVKGNGYGHGAVKVAEAAEILGVAQGTVRSWAEAGKIPMHKNPANGYRLFRRKDLMKFLSTVAVPASTPKSRKS